MKEKLKQDQRNYINRFNDNHYCSIYFNGGNHQNH